MLVIKTCILVGLYHLNASLDISYCVNQMCLVVNNHKRSQSDENYCYGLFSRICTS